MRCIMPVLTALTLLVALPAQAKLMPAPEPELEVIAELDQRPGNVAVSMEGRVFITMHPFDKPRCQVMEVLGDKTVVPYPSEEVSCGTLKESTKNAKGVENRIYGAIGLRTTLHSTLIVLDMGTKTVAPRLVSISIGQNAIDNAVTLPATVVTDQSFLQDFAYDWYTNNVYVADMGQADLTGTPKPAIIMVSSGPTLPSRRVLESDPSVMPPATPMQAGGKDVTVLKDGKPVPVMAGLNPITIDPQNGWLYYAPMAAGKISRIPLDKIGDTTIKPEEMGKYVEPYADKPASDGMTIDAQGNIYLTSVNTGEIGIIDYKTRQYRTYLKDARLIWPDGFAFGPDGMLYVTINQLHKAAALNLGKEEGVKPYLVARFKPVVMGTIGR